MSNIKTSITGIVTGIFAILAAFGVGVPDAISSEQAVGIIAGVGAMLIGIFAKDHNVTGGTVSQ